MLTLKSLDNEEKTTSLFYVQVNRVSKKVDLWTRLLQAMKKVRYPFFQSLLLLEDLNPGNTEPSKEIIMGYVVGWRK